MKRGMYEESRRKDVESMFVDPGVHPTSFLTQVALTQPSDLLVFNGTSTSVVTGSPQHIKCKICFCIAGFFLRDFVE